MIAFAFLDASGIPTGGGIGPKLPDGAVELTPPFTTIDLPRIRFLDGAWVERPAPPPPSAEEIAARTEGLLRRARAEAAEVINARAGDLRRRFVTAIPGQEAIYLEKRAEARAYIAAASQGGDPQDLADYPLLAGEVGLTAPDAWQLAQVWLNRAHLFKRVGAATEGARLAALAALTIAPDYDTIEAIQTDFTQALSRLSL
jgi:hypothetical protein